MTTVAARPRPVFEFDDYKAYLNSVVQGDSEQKSGRKTALAKAMRCQPPYLSRVLNGDAHLNADQLSLASDYLGLKFEEADFLLLLMHQSRAATDTLKRHYNHQLTVARAENLRLHSRVTLKQPLSAEVQATYYSSWAYAAVHMALTIKRLNTASKVAKYLRLPLKRVDRIIDFLQTAKLIREKSGTYELTEKTIHLKFSSPLAPKHHTNWRMRAIEVADEESAANLQYSSTISVSRSDFDRIKQIFLEANEKARALIKDSREEIVAYYGYDFFEVGAADE